MNSRGHVSPGFTLIELLIATSLSVAMLALVIASFQHISRMALLAENRLVLHQVAANVHRSLSSRLRAQHPCTAWRLEVDPTPPTGLAALPAGSFALTFMASNASTDERTGGLDTRDFVDVSWWRLVWMPPAAGSTTGARLALVPGTAARRSPTPSSYSTTDRIGIPDPNIANNAFRYEFVVSDWARRDRRRDMDDNDLRHWSGMTATMYDHITNAGTTSPPDLIGDERSLWQRLQSGAFDLAGGAGLEVPACAISWTDFGGQTVTYTSGTSGLVRTGVAALGHAHDDAEVAARDGLFSDGRRHIPPDDGAGGRDVLAQRPGVVRLAFTLSRRLGPAAGARDERDAAGFAIVTQRFHLAFPLGPLLPAP